MTRITPLLLKSKECFQILFVSPKWTKLSTNRVTAKLREQCNLDIHTASYYPISVSLLVVFNRIILCLKYSPSAQTLILCWCYLELEHMEVIRLEIQGQGPMMGHGFMTGRTDSHTLLLSLSDHWCLLPHQGTVRPSPDAKLQPGTSLLQTYTKFLFVRNCPVCILL